MNMRIFCIITVLFLSSCAHSLEKQIEQSKQICIASGVSEKDMPNCIISVMQSEKQRRATLGAAFLMR